MITPPTIHLNGTSAESLLEDALDVMRKISELLDAMQKGAPNARDYYVQGPDAFGKARAEHQWRMEQIQGVYDEYKALAHHISEASGR